VAAPTRYVEGTDVLAAAVRRLVDAVVRTQVDTGTVLAAARAVDDVTASLSGSLREGPYRPDLEDPGFNAHNLVTGTAHPFAPPVEVVDAGPDGVTVNVRFGTAYEGAPGLVHGGILSLVMDHLFGQVALAAGYGSMTVGLELRYRAPTPLHTDLVAQGRVVGVDGRKVRLAGTVTAGDVTTVEATALFLQLDAANAASLFPHLAAG
jgi:acyl-coenzyme A thioesterase PaaI-like protein